MERTIKSSIVGVAMTRFGVSFSAAMIAAACLGSGPLVCARGASVADRSGPPPAGRHHFDRTISRLVPESYSVKIDYWGVGRTLGQARAWMEYVRTGALGDSTPPPAPFSVRVSPKGEKGTEIIWNAEANFESGISQFIGLRDGPELARVPQKPGGKFGRPSFQPMTHHDTPGQPVPAMRYVDASANSGDRHACAIITVNSVGLKSNPAAESVGGAEGK